MTRLFLDKTDRPDDKKLAKGLGPSYKLWREIEKELTGKYGNIKPEWKYYGAKSGWTMKMMMKKKNLFFFGPCENFFIIGFVFGDRAEEMIRESGISPSLITEFKNAKRYAEGRGISIEVRGLKQVKDALKLAEIKINYLGLK